MEESVTSSPKNESFCKVCGDKASGKHYGVASCDGCRGFFKRSIRRNLEYVCKENGHCIVDVTRRNQCQACRFKKCLQVNMKRDAVQHERAPRVVTQSALHHHYSLNLPPRVRNCHGTSLFSGIPLHIQTPSVIDHNIGVMSGISSHYLHQSVLFPGMLSSYNKHSFFSSTLGSSTLPYPHKQDPPLLTDGLHIKRIGINIKEDEVTSSEETSNNNEDVRIPSPPNRSRLELPILGDYRSGLRSLDISSLSLFPTENVYESSAKLLFLAVKWARTIPSFLQLSYRDQSILLEESWSELFVLTAAQWALPIDEALLVNNALAPATRQIELEEDARKLHEVITRLTLLRVDHTEHAFLKALVLFKGDSRGLCEPNHVELLQDQTHVMLHEYCSQKYTSYKGRFGKLLLSLLAVQSISRRGLEELLFRQTVGDVAVDRLLGELAKATHT
ncbi:hypothetical protein PPYR_09524 [Photinus pyralis]|uniref:Nuclear receptor subfamily 2 group E member 1 n=1 Tax=Photinus pyralis TaxID=7054 RepID=A0A5N4AMK3_PHOPY|nr:hypothetical protein PPYR_09524 [Photinus pyralis]